MGMPTAIVLAGVIISFGIIFGFWLSRPIPSLKDCLQAYQIQKTKTDIISPHFSCNTWIDTINTKK